MSDFLVDFVIDIYTTANTTTKVGFDSLYTNVPHPTTGKRIEGWKWDERAWDNKAELITSDFIPSIFDASKNFIDESKFQSGIGDNDDLVLISTEEQKVNDSIKWVPKINHGYFYSYDDQWYLYSDDLVKQVFVPSMTTWGTYPGEILGKTDFELPLTASGMNLVSVSEVTFEHDDLSETLLVPSVDYTFSSPTVNLLVGNVAIDEALRISAVYATQLSELDLQFKPKPTIPISVRRYKWNKNKERYEVYFNYRKRPSFTGEIVNDANLDTVDDSGNIIVDNVDSGMNEFLVDYDRDTPRLTLSNARDYPIGVSGDLNSLELLGIADGDTNLYHLRYSPVHTGVSFQLISWDGITGDTYSWSKIDPVSSFSEGPYQEFKLDPILGTVEFGDYDSTTQSGSGAKPSERHFIGAAYTPGIEVTYEPEFSRDWIEAKTADLNPLHNASHHGFIEVTPQDRIPSYISLRSDDLSGDAKNGYSIDFAGFNGELLAVLRDKSGTLLDGQQVEFEILNPKLGTFGNLENTITVLTDSDGVARARFAPPSTILELGKLVTEVTKNSTTGTTHLSIDDLMVDETNLDSIYLFKVLNNDEVLGIPESQESANLLNYLVSGEIVEDPNGPLSTGYESSWRSLNYLPTPTKLSDGDLRNGLKVLVGYPAPGYPGLSDTIDPSWGIDNNSAPNGIVKSPLFPFYANVAGSIEASTLELDYWNTDGAYWNLIPLPGADIKSYMIVAEAATRIRAKVTDSASGKVVTSNIITITIRLSEETIGDKLLSTNSDIVSNLFKHPPDVDKLSDAEILTYYPELESDYLAEHLLTTTLTPITWSGDNNTIGYWPLDEDYSDYSGNGFNLTNYNFSHIENGGKVGDAWESSRTANSNLYSEEIFPYNPLFPLQSGTMDFLFRSKFETYSGIWGAATDPFSIPLFQFIAKGVVGDVSNNDWDIAAYLVDTSVSGQQIRFNYSIGSPNDAGPQAYLLDTLSDKEIILTDTQWHSLRFTWEYTPNDSIVRLGAQIDNTTLSGGLTYYTLSGIPAFHTITISGWNSVAEDTVSTGLRYDMIRLSDNVRTDAWPPIAWVEVEETFTEWFRRTQRGNTDLLGLEEVQYSGTVPASIPYGFRLKDSQFDVASRLDTATFITFSGNLPVDYFDKG